MQWNSVSGAVSYEIHYNGDSIVKVVGDHIATFSGFISNTQYYVKVYAIDSNGNRGEQSANVPVWTTT